MIVHTFRDVLGSFQIGGRSEPILMGPIPRVQSNPPDDHDTTTTTAAAAQSQETTSRETTQSIAAERAPPGQRPRTTVSFPRTATAETTPWTTTTTPTRALVERVGSKAGEDSQPFQMRRIATLTAQCEDTTTSDAISEARRKHRDHQTLDKTFGGQCGRRRREEGQVDDALVRANSERNEDFFSAKLAMMQLKMMLVEAALKGLVVAIVECCGPFTSHL